MVNTFVAYDENPARYRAEVLRSIEQAAQVGEEQIEQLRSINRTMDDLLREMAATRRTATQGLALQQAMLAREVIQEQLEEFVYQFEKMIAEYQRPQTDVLPAMRFYFLDCMFRQIDADGISTAIIKGRENKAAFDQCVTKGKTLYRQLTKHPEVKQALAWAEAEKQKRQIAEAKRQRQEEQGAKQEELRGIKERIQGLRSRMRDSPAFGEWYKRKFGKIPLPLHVFMWWFWGFAWIPIFFLISGPAEQKAANAALEDEIAKLRKRAAVLQQPK